MALVRMPAMNRARWLIVGAGVAFVAAIGMFALIFHDKFRPRVMGGPIAITKGKGSFPKHGFLGVSIDGTTAPPTVAAVYEGSGADEAGMLAGDILASAGTVTTPNYAALQRVLETTAPGDELPLTIRRENQEILMKVRLINYHEMAQLAIEWERQNPRR